MAINSQAKAILYKAKEQYDNVFTTTIEGENFIFRPLSKFEYEELVLKDDLSKFELEESICELAVIYPTLENYSFENNHKAGIATSLSKQIKQVSGFGDEQFINKQIENFRQSNEENTYRYMENVISYVFKEIEPYDMKHWDVYKLTDYFTRAEWILQNIEGLQTKNTNQEEQQQQPPPQQQNVPKAPGVNGEVEKAQSFTSGTLSQSDEIENKQVSQEQLQHRMNRQGMGSNVLNKR